MDSKSQQPKKVVVRRARTSTGDAVFVFSPNPPRSHWPLGRVVGVHHGKGGRVRFAKVQVGKKEANQTYFEALSLGTALEIQ